MSIGNKKADPKKIYSYLDRPPVFECGGKLDKDGIDTYWGESLTLQSEADSANITLIMEKYSKTGVMNVPVRENLQYADLSNLPDLHQAQNEIAKARELFETLPAKQRLRFQNNPAEMLNFLGDENNYDEAFKLGLVTERKKEETIPIPAPIPAKVEPAPQS
jgi:phage internal scaffolding protein